MPLNIIIAEDDENLANSLSRDCEKIQDIRVVATVQNGKRLVQLAMEMNPEVVITDIKMPGISGIQAARRIREYNQDIDIIFLTAYEDFVRDAFEVYALDYLIKPINKNRLYKTLERAKKLHKDTGKIISLPCKGEIRYVNTKDVLFVEAQGKKARVVTREREMFVNANLAYILKESDGQLFQSNRSFLVNLKHVKGIKRLNRSSFEIYFDFTDKTALLSNRLYEDFRRKIKEIYN